ncbi:MCE family protein [Planomonospora corallina]|uniref:MCE family protein n=1 Tax=Planomonospora corallina TaxID=1806052 RepID=A0ABV8I745_9ACTN
MTRDGLSLPVRLAISLAVIVSVAAALVLVVRGASEVNGTRLSAAFGRSGQGLDANSPVKIRGITVGGVSGVTLDSAGRAVVSLYVDPGVKVPETVTAVIEPTSVFGPKFVNLVPGDGEAGGPFLGDGAVITRTEDPVDLSDSLGDAYEGLGAVDPADVTTIVHTLGRALDGKGPQLRELLDGAGEVVGVAHRRRGEYTRFIGDAAALSGALADRGDELVGITADVNALTPGLLERADKVRALLREFDEVSALTAHGLRSHRGDVRAAGTSAERVVNLLYADLGIAGDGIRGLNTLVAELNDLIGGQGPDGANQLKMAAYIHTDLCTLFVGACGPENGR